VLKSLFGLLPPRIKGQKTMHFLAQLILFALEVYMWIIIAEVVISWLVLFGVVNLQHPKAQSLVRLINKATEPVMGPVRKVVPPIAGLDLSPLVVIFGIMLLKGLVVSLFY
jgi:YggT family protein